MIPGGPPSAGELEVDAVVLARVHALRAAWLLRSCPAVAHCRLDVYDAAAELAPVAAALPESTRAWLDGLTRSELLRVTAAATAEALRVPVAWISGLHRSAGAGWAAWLAVWGQTECSARTARRAVDELEVAGDAVRRLRHVELPYVAPTRGRLDGTPYASSGRRYPRRCVRSIWYLTSAALTACAGDEYRALVGAIARGLPRSWWAHARRTWSWLRYRRAIQVTRRAADDLRRSSADPDRRRQLGQLSRRTTPRAGLPSVIATTPPVDQVDPEQDGASAIGLSGGPGPPMGAGPPRGATDRSTAETPRPPRPPPPMGEPRRPLEATSIVVDSETAARTLLPVPAEPDTDERARRRELLDRLGPRAWTGRD